MRKKLQTKIRGAVSKNCNERKVERARESKLINICPKIRYIYFRITRKLSIREERMNTYCKKIERFSFESAMSHKTPSHPQCLVSFYQIWTAKRSWTGLVPRGYSVICICDRNFRDKALFKRFLHWALRFVISRSYGRNFRTFHPIRFVSALNGHVKWGWRAFSSQLLRFATFFF